MALLIYSNKCKHSKNTIEFLNSHEELKQITRLHCIDTHGLPQQYKQYVTSVPTLITNKNQILVGKECKSWLESLIPPDEISHCQLGGCGNFGTFALEGDETAGDYFDLNNYGVELQPTMTPELQDRINKKVS